MNIAALSLRLLEPKRRAFESATRNPIQAQERVLFEYLRRNKDTEYGRSHGFKALKSVADYQKSVPLVDYEAIRRHIDRMADGENNILMKDRVVFFGITSGTTDKPKLIPTTRYAESKKDELLYLWSHYIARDHPDVASGKILALVSPEREGLTRCGIPFGAESGHSYRSLPRTITALYALPYEVFEIEDYDSRHYAILRISIEQDITSIATLNPNMIVLLCKKVGLWQDTIVDDIARGTLSPRFKIPQAIRASLEKRIRPNPRRAAALTAILNNGKPLIPKYFWPRLELLECWQGGLMKLYLKELDTFFGDIPRRDMGCLSTEARFSIPIRDNTASGILAIQTNFFEFIPKEEIGRKSPRTLLCDQLEVGKDYFIVVTTPAGLYRYNIDDMVRVTGFYNKTPLIEFMQKGLNTSSLAGEKLYEYHINNAVNIALERSGMTAAFFCAVADPGHGPRYNFLVEFSGTPTRQKAIDFLSSVENELVRQDREYEYVRNAQLLKSPVLKIVKKGSFERYRSRRIAEGAQEGQFKAQELTTDSGFESNFMIDETIALS